MNAFPFVAAPKYLLRDRDRIYGEEFKRRIGNLGMEELKNRSPDGEETRLEREVKAIIANPSAFTEVTLNIYQTRPRCGPAYRLDWSNS